jgi:hypothetical protein
MTDEEIREHISTAHAYICHAMDELKAIHAHMSWQDLLRIKRRLQDLERLFEIGGQEAKK